MKTFKEFLVEISSSLAMSYIRKSEWRNINSHNRAADILMNRDKAYSKKTSCGCVGNCVNSFRVSDGECKNTRLPYRDATHFAQSEENAEEISKEEFEKHHPIPEKFKKISNHKDTRFLHDKDNRVHMIHDTNKDVHHFFVKE